MIGGLSAVSVAVGPRERGKKVAPTPHADVGGRDLLQLPEHFHHRDHSPYRATACQYAASSMQPRSPRASLVLV
jgi:hypothetical protein